MPPVKYGVIGLLSVKSVYKAIRVGNKQIVPDFFQLGRNIDAISFASLNSIVRLLDGSLVSVDNNELIEVFK